MYMEYWLPGAICALAALLLALAACTRLGFGCSKTEKAVRKILAGTQDLSSCDMTNLAQLQTRFDGCGNEYLKKGFAGYSDSISKMFKNEIAPEPDGFFGYDNIITYNYSEGLVSAVWGLLGVLGLLALVTPPTMLLIGGAGVKEELPLCLGIALIGVVLIAAIFAAFYAYVQIRRRNASRALFMLRSRLTELLPTATESTRAALLLEGSRKNTEAFRQTARDIADKIDDFTVNGITPVVSAAFTDAIENKLMPPIGMMGDNLGELSRQVLQRQDEGMRQLAGSFADKLDTTLGASVKAVCGDLDALNGRLTDMTGRLDDAVKTLDGATQADRDMLAEVAKLTQHTAKTQDDAAQQLTRLNAALERSEQLVNNVKERDDAAAASVAAQLAAMARTQAQFEQQLDALKQAGRDTAQSLAQSADSLRQSVENQTAQTAEKVDGILSGYSEKLMTTLEKAVMSNDSTAEKLAQTMDSLGNAGSEQYEKAAQAAAKLLNDVVVEMNKAMDGVGHEIAESISAASAGSAEIVDKLAEKTAQLKEEYDTYFSRCQDQNASNISDMEMALQGVLTRFSEDAGGIMGKLEQNISGAMNLFEGNTAELLSSLEEQARSIGLYAKELNLDVSNLSDSLRQSVQIFTDQISQGTQRTFSEFDSGLAEVSQRLANTVESVREAVERLPEALDGAK